ncbi:hypothetical protein PSTEL_14950 [Paenibacillus stellifer]|uniref:Uncharacterized protein n=1 Tax=Paenibacillus stellifer TaxID=169760 RepID=A0A089LY26_9BACL|nr:hypothetical protein [Paenibacillus stellifer]AIQ64183.1 hypothetical protein PSTEL_14950 [Paenibacillus stellifer]
METHLQSIILAYKSDPESVYNTWFINNEDRLKAFRTIKSGVSRGVKAIEHGMFGSDYKGSPLETVVTAIAEQKQVFEGAAHPRYLRERREQTGLRPILKAMRLSRKCQSRPAGNRPSG